MPETIEDREKDKRLDTKRRPASRPYCDICVEEAKFDYLLKPPQGIRQNELNKQGRAWCTLCQLCFEVWLESGEHCVLPSGNLRAVGHKGRPLMQDELDALRAGKRGTIDSSTGLMTYDWRRP